MKQKLSIILILGLVMFIIVKNSDLKKTYLEESDTVGVYINNELSDKIPSKDEAIFYKAICDDENVSVSWDNESWGLLLKNLTKKAKCNLYFYQGDTVFNFDYTGAEQTFTAPVSGTYKLETWGSQVGSINENYIGGVGGYSNGYITLGENQKLFIQVGGSGDSKLPSTEKILGGYNGGGTGYSNYDVHISSSGGGATHMALCSGLLSELPSDVEKIVLVSGGGGGSYSDQAYIGSGGAGGGYKGTVSSDFSSSRQNQLPSEAGTQLSGGHWGRYYSSTYDGLSDKANGSFGKGGYIDVISSIDTIIGGGGGGFYGGGASYQSAGAGGSGYIGNSLLTNKVMYCHNCEESNEESTKTISTTCSEETPTENCAKKGNGYARITLVSISE